MVGVAQPISASKTSRVHRVIFHVIPHVILALAFASPIGVRAQVDDEEGGVHLPLEPSQRVEDRSPAAVKKKVSNGINVMIVDPDFRSEELERLGYQVRRPSQALEKSEIPKPEIRDSFF